MKTLFRQAAIGPDDDLLRWYVVEARNGREGRVCRILLALGLEAWRPVASERGKTAESADAAHLALLELCILADRAEADGGRMAVLGDLEPRRRPARRA